MRVHAKDDVNDSVKINGTLLHVVRAQAELAELRRSSRQVTKWMLRFESQRGMVQWYLGRVMNRLSWYILTLS